MLRRTRPSIAGNAEETYFTILWLAEMRSLDTDLHQIGLVSVFLFRKYGVDCLDAAFSSFGGAGVSRIEIVSKVIGVSGSCHAG
jgi:hypothetical protein